MASVSSAADKVTIDHDKRSFTIRTKRLVATIRDGVIVNLDNRLTGELLADQHLGENRMPTGLGHLTDNIPAMSSIHHVWGKHASITQGAKGSLPNFHAPCGQSRFTCTYKQNVVVATWHGLHNENTYFPDEMLTITASSDKRGALNYKATATSVQGGVFGVVVPLANINSNAIFYLPSFGGMRLRAAPEPWLRTYGEAPFFEAPIIAAEIGKGSLAIWREDGEFHPYFTFFNWSGKSFAFAFEHLNLMPFEPHKEVNSVTWKLDVSDGGWMAAMAPYRDWYAKHFAAEIEVRDGVGWADKIGVIIDDFAFNRASLERIAARYPAERILFHQWTARKEGFSANLPDMQPTKGHVAEVALLHEFGFKAMAYVNSYCAVYNSPAWQRDKLSEKFLTRKYSLQDYGKSSTDKELDNLIGDVQGQAGANQFAHLKDGAFLYGDPLHPGWRSYHAAQMAWWNSTTGTDANYEDTAGCAGDFGNGIIEGKFAAQGSVAAMRALLERQSHVPMGSEYGPESIAFAAKWPLVYAQVWGGEEFRTYRVHAQAPVNAFLFGYRTWVPTINAGSDFLKHVVTACSDASGGMGMTTVGAALAVDETYGFTGHMAWRAALFAKRGLKPWFDPNLRVQNLVCAYRDSNGKIYRYLDDGCMQRMVGPDGKPLYARIEQTSRLKTELVLPGWPATTENEIFGLSPDKRYALFPASPSMPKPPVRIAALPEEVFVRGCRWASDYMLIVLDKKPATLATGQKVSIKLVLDQHFADLTCNGETEKLSPHQNERVLETTLPAYILLSRQAREPLQATPFITDFDKLKIYKISRDTGLHEASDTNQLASLKRHIKTADGKQQLAIALWGADWENTLDFLIRVPAKPTVLKVYTQNHSLQYGDATIAKLYLNGELIYAHDAFSPRPDADGRQDGPDSKAIIRDGQCHEWSVPLEKYAGQPLLVTIASDPKNDNNADQQWMSIPFVVNAE